MPSHYIQVHPFSVVNRTLLTACYQVMSGIMLKAQADPCESIFLPRSTDCKVNFGGGKPECYQYTYETINATSQPYILDFELAVRRCT